METIVYGDQPETVLRSEPRLSAGAANHVLLGTWLRVAEDRGDWLLVETRGEGQSGWARRSDVRTTPCLKVFYVDVGQGDGAIIESPQGVVLIDGGPSIGLHRFVRYRYRKILDAGERCHFEALVISHPDADHYAGFTPLLRDKEFSFGSIYHTGIVRFGQGAGAPPFELGLLRTRKLTAGSRTVLAKTFSTLEDARQLVQSGSLSQGFRAFWDAALQARTEGRLRAARRITSRVGVLPGFGGSGEDSLRIEVLGPVPTRKGGAIEYETFADPHEPGSLAPSASHTVNGHSAVLKLHFGKHSFLFGGDLNTPAEHHLIAHYGAKNPFRVDVAKACHHGSSDFTVEFLRKIQPHATVFSSGDNKTFDHPMADALGAVGRHMRGSHPLLFSTELARAIGKTGVHYGLINARSNGRTLVMAQMKEVRGGRADVWDSFTVPWKGAFAVT